MFTILIVMMLLILPLNQIHEVSNGRLQVLEFFMSAVSLFIFIIDADCERVFSWCGVSKLTRSGLLPDTISSLIGVHFNSAFSCGKQSCFETFLLDKGNLALDELNIHSVTHETNTSSHSE